MILSVNIISFWIIVLELKDVIAEVFSHLGPKQLGQLKDLVGAGKKPDEIKEAANEEDEDVPTLANQNFEKAGGK